MNLFTRSIPVFIGPYTLKPGDHQWPFEFIIPDCCEKDESQEFLDKKSSQFDDDFDQDLPPTIPEVLSRNFTTSGNSFSISYPLTASVLIDRTIGSKQEDVVQNLNIQPWRAVEHPSWRSISQTCKFQTLIGDTPLASQRRSSIFKRRPSVQQESYFAFSLDAKLATTVVIGKPIPMFVTLQHGSPLDSGPSMTDTPTFQIKSISACLVTDNAIRSQGSHQEMYLSGSAESCWSDTISIGSKLPIPVPISNGETLDFRRLIPDFVIPASESPSFFSFSVCRVHEMYVKIEIECNGQSFTATYKTKRTILLSEQSRSDVAVLASSGTVIPGEDLQIDRRNDSFVEANAEEGDAPPSFGAATIGQEVLPGYSRDGSY